MYHRLCGLYTITIGWTWYTTWDDWLNFVNKCKYRLRMLCDLSYYIDCPSSPPTVAQVYLVSVVSARRGRTSRSRNRRTPSSRDWGRIDTAQVLDHRETRPYTAWSGCRISRIDLWVSVCSMRSRCGVDVSGPVKYRCVIIKLRIVGDLLTKFRSSCIIIQSDFYFTFYSYVLSMNKFI